MDEQTREEWLRDRQDGRVYPVGRALRATFDADNHETLGSDVAGLMIDLSRVPDAASAAPPVAPAPPARPPAGLGRPSILARMTGLFAKRSSQRTR